jgi:Tol biopolymer transport system component
MKRASLPLLASAAALFALLATPAPVLSFYGNAADEGDGAFLVSADYARLEQGDDTTDYAAISADGRYVVIQTRSRNFFADDDPDPPDEYRAGGLFRFDLQTKALEKVADGNLFAEANNSFVRLGASKPSVSADGRYVAFVSAEKLLPADTNENLDAYVRDMEIPEDEPGAFDLVSARNGSDVPASYGPPAFPLPGSEPGADVTRGVSISADGQKVVFRTTAPSDLPESGSAGVPAGQVFLRNRATNTTTLVSAKRDSGTGEMTEEPAGGATGATLSADGTTVAWTGGNAAAQTRFLGGENQDPSFRYYLWRRVAEGPSALTRRITGAADPDDPTCPPAAITSFDRNSTGPCFGPLTDQEGLPSDIGTQVPVLSGDGFTVAFLTGAAARPLESINPGLDLFVASMTSGLSRKQATVELTRDTLDNDIATGQPISSVAMSPDGRYLAITSVRTRFVLPALQQLGEPRSVPGPRELYVVDLQQRTIERATRSYSGGDIDSPILESATISAGGDRVAFASSAGNLFFGDANQRADAFVATRRPDPGAVPLENGAGDNGPAGTIEVDSGGPLIAARAKSKAGGVVVLIVSVPAAGGVKAVANARAGRPSKLRTLATATGRAAGTGRSEVRLELRPVERYRSELRERGSISGRVQIGYVASRGGRRASTSVHIAFRQALSSSHHPRRRRK